VTRTKPTNQHRRGREEPAAVTDFIRLVHSRLSGSAPLHQDGIWFSRRDEGSLFLDAEEAKAYSGVVTELMKGYVPHEDLSRRSVERFLQGALFESLDLRSRSTRSFDERLRKAVDQLLVLLQAPSDKFMCWVPVEGLKLDQAGAHFGSVRFVKFGRHQLRQLTRRRPTPGGRSVPWKQSLKSLRDKRLWGAVCAAVEVQARDTDSAEVLALRRTRQVTAMVNVFTDLVPYNHGWIYLRGEATRSQQIVPIQKANGDFTASHTTLEPFAEMSWKALRAAKSIGRPFSTLNRLAQSTDNADNCANILLSAAQWAGAATVERRREQSFLLFAIALETMMLPTHEGGELGYRLRVRAAHVLGKTEPARQRIAKEVGRLYGIRSRIVHTGSYEVTDSDLGSLRSIVKGALFRLLHFRDVHSKSRQELATWLDRKILR
jgi:Apea-like HEPN